MRPDAVFDRVTTDPLTGAKVIGPARVGMVDLADTVALYSQES